MNFDPKVHRATTFLSPYRSNWTGELQYYTPDVREGSLVIFPANMPHWQEPHHQEVESTAYNSAWQNDPSVYDKPRTIVSFNIRGQVDFVKRRVAL